jgi:iron(III) transport system substrate-binding protein
VTSIPTCESCFFVPKVHQVHRLAILLTAAMLTLMSSGSRATAQSTPAPAAPNWDTIVANAKKEGNLTFYTATPPPVLRAILSSFHKAYPDIDVEFERGPSGLLTARVAQEKAGEVIGADVFISTDLSWMMQQADAGALLNVQGPSLKEWPASYIRGGKIVIAGQDLYTLAYNTELIKDPPKTYQDLLKPEYKGKLAVAELSSTSVYAWYDWLEKTNGKDFLKELRAQKPKFYVGCLPAIQAVAAGEVAATLLSCPSTTKSLKDQGATVNDAFSEPLFGFDYFMAALGWSKHPNAALVFVNWIMSRDGQTTWQSIAPGGSPLSDIPNALPQSAISTYDVDGWPLEAMKRYATHWNQIIKE